MTSRAGLPNLDTLDFTTLKALVLSQHEELLTKDTQLASRDAEIEQLKLLIAKLRRIQFGRKSEKLQRQIEQLELRLEELEAERAERSVISHTPAVSAFQPETKRTRQPLPHLPP